MWKGRAVFRPRPEASRPQGVFSARIPGIGAAKQADRRKSLGRNHMGAGLGARASARPAKDARALQVEVIARDALRLQASQTGTSNAVARPVGALKRTLCRRPMSSTPRASRREPENP
jgi:hypothetical protein